MFNLIFLSQEERLLVHVLQGLESAVYVSTTYFLLILNFFLSFFDFDAWLWLELKDSAYIF